MKTEETIDMKKIFYFIVPVLLFISCKLMPKKENTDSKKETNGKQLYGMIGTDSVFQYTLTNKKGMTVKILDYGGTVTDIITPDKNGEPGDVILGYDSLGGFLQKDNPYFGAIVGRYANRIANAQFSLNGKTYHLAANNDVNSLHGGWKGFDKQIWKVKSFEPTGNEKSLSLEYKSKDGEEGYPGNLTADVTYTLTDNNELKISYNATTDQATPINLTNHSYFNLSAGKDSNILNHVLMLNADKYTEVNDKLIPTGRLPDVKGTAMDFRKAKRVGQDIDKVPGGYDHNFVLNRKNDSLDLAASVYDPTSGRYLEVFTTQPGIQFYTGNFLNGLKGRTGKIYEKHAALCLETQHFPDSPNQPSFPNTILKPGETFNQETVYKFSVK